MLLLLRRVTYQNILRLESKSLINQEDLHLYAQVHLQVLLPEVFLQSQALKGWEE